MVTYGRSRPNVTITKRTGATRMSTGSGLTKSSYRKSSGGSGESQKTTAKTIIEENKQGSTTAADIIAQATGSTKQTTTAKKIIEEAKETPTNESMSKIVTRRASGSSGTTASQIIEEARAPVRRDYSSDIIPTKDIRTDIKKQMDKTSSYAPVLTKENLTRLQRERETTSQYQQSFTQFIKNPIRKATRKYQETVTPIFERAKPESRDVDIKRADKETEMFYDRTGILQPNMQTAQERAVLAGEIYRSKTLAKDETSFIKYVGLKGKEFGAKQKRFNLGIREGAKKVLRENTATIIYESALAGATGFGFGTGVLKGLKTSSTTAKSLAKTGRIIVGADVGYASVKAYTSDDPAVSFGASITKSAVLYSSFGKGASIGNAPTTGDVVTNIKGTGKKIDAKTTVFEFENVITGQKSTAVQTPNARYEKITTEKGFVKKITTAQGVEYQTFEGKKLVSREYKPATPEKPMSGKVEKQISQPQTKESLKSDESKSIFEVAQYGKQTVKGETSKVKQGIKQTESFNVEQESVGKTTIFAESQKEVFKATQFAQEKAFGEFKTVDKFSLVKETKPQFKLDGETKVGGFEIKQTKTPKVISTYTKKPVKFESVSQTKEIGFKYDYSYKEVYQTGKFKIKEFFKSKKGGVTLEKPKGLLKTEPTISVETTQPKFDNFKPFKPFIAEVKPPKLNIPPYKVPSKPAKSITHTKTSIPEEPKIGFKSTPSEKLKEFNKKASGTNIKDIYKPASDIKGGSSYKPSFDVDIKPRSRTKPKVTQDTEQDTEQITEQEIILDKPQRFVDPVIPPPIPQPRTPDPFIPSPTPPPIDLFGFPPLFKPSGGVGGSGFKTRSYYKQPKQYTPTAYAAFLGIKGKKTKSGEKSGLGLRPIQNTKPKKRKMRL